MTEMLLPASSSNEGVAEVWRHPVTLVVNGQSRRGRDAFQELQRQLIAAGIRVGRADLGRDSKGTKTLLEEEVRRGAKAVIVGGGDGTLHACAQVLAGSPVAMGIVPLGTGNTFVRSLGIPLNMAEAVRELAKGRVASVDVGLCNGEIFLNSVSLGLSVAVAGTLRPEAKKWLGPLAYVGALTKVLLRYRPVQLRIAAAERTYTVRTHQLVIANGRFLAGPVPASPEASLSNARLDVFILGGREKTGLLRGTWAWLRQQQRHSPETRFFETTRLTVSARHSLRANLDGELSQSTPLDIAVLPGGLKVIVPAGSS